MISTVSMVRKGIKLVRSVKKVNTDVSMVTRAKELVTMTPCHD